MLFIGRLFYPSILKDIRMQFLSKNMFSDIYKIVFTLCLAFACAIFFQLLNVPAPYFLGSLIGVFIIGTSIRQTQPLLSIANWFYLPVIIGISVMIGTNFTPDIFQSAQKWTFSVIIMIVATVCVTFISFQFLRRVKLYEPKQAFLCSIPGGQAEAVVMAHEVVEKDYVVALFHLVRVAVVFISTPLLLAFVEGNLAIKRSNEILNDMSNFTDLSVIQIVMFLILCFGGFWIAKLFRMPLPHLLGPIFLSSILHVTGIIQLHRISEVVIIAQLTIGASVGARLAKISLFELKTALFDACITSGLIITTYLLVAWLVVTSSNVTFLSIWLAFVPGGLYEATILALIFGYDVAFVAFHHLVRVLLIFVSMPIFVSRIRKSE